MTLRNSNINFSYVQDQYLKLKKRIDVRTKKVLNHQKFIMGPEVLALEEKLKEFTKTKYVITCANGTDALSLVLMSWNLGEKDVVFVPSFTYIASAEAPSQLGLKIYLVDVDTNTFNMDANSLKEGILKVKKMGLNPSVVLAVDLFGLPADFKKLNGIAKEEGMKVLIDGAQSFGSEYYKNKLGSYGDAATTSFFPAKPLGCYGDGGAIFTQDRQLYKKLDSLRFHGKGQSKYEHDFIGMNSRLDTIQAAILLEKLNVFPKELEKRNKNASIFNKELTDFFEVPHIAKNYKSSWAQYTLKTSNRELLIKKLKKADIPFAIYYPKPISRQTGYKKIILSKNNDKNSLLLSKKSLSIPVHSYLTESQLNFIIEKIKN